MDKQDRPIFWISAIALIAFPTLVGDMSASSTAAFIGFGVGLIIGALAYAGEPSSTDPFVGRLEISGVRHLKEDFESARRVIGLIQATRLAAGTWLFYKVLQPWFTKNQSNNARTYRAVRRFLVHTWFERGVMPKVSQSQADQLAMSYLYVMPMRSR